MKKRSKENLAVRKILNNTSKRDLVEVRRMFNRMFVPVFRSMAKVFAVQHIPTMAEFHERTKTDD